MIMPVLFLFVKQNRNYNSYITTAGGRTMLLFDTQQIGNRLLADYFNIK